MFNVKKKIYVAHEDELIDMMYERFVVLGDRYETNEFVSFDDTRINTQQTGCVFRYDDLDQMIEQEFDGKVEGFYKFLEKEQNLTIVVTEPDYAKLYAWMCKELIASYNMKEGKAVRMLTTQRIKDFLSSNGPISEFCAGSISGVSAFENIWKDEFDAYKPTRKLFGVVHELPFEVAYALYKWGNITKTQANTKINVMARHLLEGQIHNLIESAKLAMYQLPDIVVRYLNNEDIQTVDDMILAIKTHDFLSRVFTENLDIDLQNADDLAEIKKLCNIIIDLDMDYDSQPEIDRAELQFYFDLYDKKDIDIIDNAKFNFLSTGTVASKNVKFNSALVMSA